MKWTPGGSTRTIEDRRGQGGGGFRGGPVGIGVVLVLLVLSVLTGRNFLSLVDPNAISGTDQPSSSGPAASSP
jgi:predicted metalloprotease